MSCPAADAHCNHVGATQVQSELWPAEVFWIDVPLSAALIAIMIAEMVFSGKLQLYKSLPMKVLSMFGVGLTNEETQQLEKQRRARASSLSMTFSELTRLLLLWRIPVRVKMVLTGEKPQMQSIKFVVFVLGCTCLVIFGNRLPGPWTQRLYSFVWVLFTLVAPKRAQSTGGHVAELGRLVAALTTSPTEAMLTNTIISVVRVLAAVWNTQQDAALDTAIEQVLFLVILTMIVSIFFQADILAARHALDSARQERTGKAIKNLVNARTDAMLQLTHDLKIFEPWQVAATLGGDLHELAGADIMAFLPLESDRELVRSMCMTTSEDAKREMADVLHISMQTISKSLIFRARVFHVPVHRIGEEAGVAHLMGICRQSRGEHNEPEQAQQGGDAPILQLPLRHHNVARASSQGSASSGGSSRRRRHQDSDSSVVSSQNLEEDEVPQDDIRCTVDSLSKSLSIDNFDDAFEEYCDIAETDELLPFFGPEGGRFLQWIQLLSNQAADKWSSSSFTYRRFGSIKLKHRGTGATYRTRVFVTFPDPYIGFNEDDGSYMVTVSLQVKEQVFDEMPRELQVVEEPEQEHSSSGPVSSQSSC